MRILERVIDVEIAVLTVLLHVTSILMNALFAFIGWVIGLSLTNFLVAIYSMNNVFFDGLILMAVVLCVDMPVEGQLLLCTTLLILFFQNVKSPTSFEDYMIQVNYTQIELL